MSEEILWVAIHRRVLVVATFRQEGTWKAYCVPVPGMDHNQEAEAYWQSEGAPMREDHARAFFGHLENTPYSS